MSLELRIMDRMIELLDSPEKWSKKAFARAESGLVEEVHSIKACCFCLDGARQRATGEVHRADYGASVAPAMMDASFRVRDCLAETIRNDGGDFDDEDPQAQIWMFNDDPARTYEEVRSVLTRARAFCATNELGPALPDKVVGS